MVLTLYSDYNHCIEKAQAFSNDIEGCCDDCFSGNAQVYEKILHVLLLFGMIIQ